VFEDKKKTVVGPPADEDTKTEKTETDKDSVSDIRKVQQHEKATTLISNHPLKMSNENTILKCLRAYVMIFHMNNYFFLQVTGYSDEEEYPDGEKYSKEQNMATRGM
jgi:hypothetical protein